MIDLELQAEECSKYLQNYHRENWLIVTLSIKTPEGAREFWIKHHTRQSGWTVPMIDHIEKKFPELVFLWSLDL